MDWKPGQLKFNDVFSASGSPSAVEKLAEYLEAGGDINARSPDSGWTLLHIACEQMNHQLIRSLCDCGAEVNIQSVLGFTPLHIAVDIDIDSVNQAIGNASYADHLTFETTRLLLTLGADPDLRTNDGLTVRQLAAVYGDQVLLRFDELVGV